MLRCGPMNWPPTTMATQHPDNATAPWWKADGSAFISTQDEIGELITLFSELSIDEYMWDWEGKYVDEAVGEKLYAQAAELLQKRPLGKEIHLTFRIPAFNGGKMHRMARAFMNILSLSDLAQDIGAPVPPVREMFLPLTVSADQLIKVRQAFMQVAEYHRNIFHDGARKHDALLSAVRVTPLVEDIDSMFSIERILQPYWKVLLEDGVNVQETGLRVFLARSDPALNSGMVAAVLAIKAALSKSDELSRELGFAVFPIIGTGSLPFRGSVNPKYTEVFLEQYSGVRTYSIQSAFRYDYPKGEVERALQLIKQEAPKRSVQHVPEEDRVKLQEMAKIFTSCWGPSIEALESHINTLAQYTPSRRERLQHIGLFGYCRGVGAVKLPRAIKFTAALYSIGVPPELIATGRGLTRVREEGLLPVLDRYYPALRADLEHAGKYLNRENVELAARKEKVFQEIKKDIEAIDAYLGTPLGPQQPRHMVHRNLTSTIFHRMQEDPVDAEAVEHDIVEAAVIRRSLG